MDYLNSALFSCCLNQRIEIKLCFMKSFKVYLFSIFLSCYLLNFDVDLFCPFSFKIMSSWTVAKHFFSHFLSTISYFLSKSDFDHFDLKTNKFHLLEIFRFPKNCRQLFENIFLNMNFGYLWFNNLFYLVLPFPIQL